MTGSPVFRQRSLAVFLTLVVIVLAFPPIAGAASSYPIITSTGQAIPSLFEGLKPSWFVHPSVLKRWQPPGRSSVWTGQLRSSLLPGTYGARYLPAQCVVCPNVEACAGHFTILVPLPPGVGCGDPAGCGSVNNFTNDPHNSKICKVGEETSYCGFVCCANADICANTSGCP